MGMAALRRKRLPEEALCSEGRGGNTPLQSVMETSSCWLLTIFVDRGSMAMMKSNGWNCHLTGGHRSRIRPLERMDTSAVGGGRAHLHRGAVTRLVIMMVMVTIKTIAKNSKV